VFNRELVPVIYGNRFLSKWLFDVEMFIRLKHFLGGKQAVMRAIYEQPLQRWVHVEDSKLGIKDALEIPLRLLNIWFNYSIWAFTNTLVTAEEQEVLTEVYTFPLAA